MTILLFIPIILFFILLSLCYNEKVLAYKGGWELSRVYQKVKAAPDMTITHASISNDSQTSTVRIISLKILPDKEAILFTTRLVMSIGCSAVTYKIADVGCNGVVNHSMIFVGEGEDITAMEIDKKESQELFNREIGFWDSILNYSI